MAHRSFNSARWSYWRSASNVASPPPLAALPGSTKAPLHLFATHIVDRHHVMTHGTFFLQWWHVHQDSFRRRTLGAAPAARPCLIPSPKLRITMGLPPVTRTRVRTPDKPRFRHHGD